MLQLMMVMKMLDVNWGGGISLKNKVTFVELLKFRFTQLSENGAT